MCIRDSIIANAMGLKLEEMFEVPDSAKNDVDIDLTDLYDEQNSDTKD